MEKKEETKRRKSIKLPPTKPRDLEMHQYHAFYKHSYQCHAFYKHNQAENIDFPKHIAKHILASDFGNFTTLFSFFGLRK